MLWWWQHIPESINPIAFTIGFFSMHWYAGCFLLGFFGAFYFFSWYTKEHKSYGLLEDKYDLSLLLLTGALVFGRLGYALLYQPGIFLAHPIFLIWPYQNGQWVGIGGMSFHGGLLGVITALFFYTSMRQRDFYSYADSIALSTPIALFFGRVGNFLNGELYGRVTEKSWGMYFGQQEVLRHPSALYEAFGEGVFLFGVLLLISRYVKLPGAIAALFLILYGGIRFSLEYFRQPDESIFYTTEILTLGQWYSLLMIFAGIVIITWLRKKNRDTLKG